MKRLNIVMTEKQATFWWVIAQNQMDCTTDRNTHRDSKALRDQIERKLDKECPGWRVREWNRKERRA